MSTSNPFRLQPAASPPTCCVRPILAPARVRGWSVIMADMRLVPAGQEEPADEIGTNG